MNLTREKLSQAADLLAASGSDVWLTFVRETVEGGDPVLPLIVDCGLTWQSALIVTRQGRKIAIVGNYDTGPLEASGDWDEVLPYVQGIRQPLLETLEKVVPQGKNPSIAVNYSLDDPKADGLSHGMFLVLQKYLAGSRFEGSLTSAESIVGALRARKTAGEIERIRGAIAETVRLFGEISDEARLGMSERAIYDFVQQRIDARGLGFSWERASDPIVNTGPDSMIGHGLPSADIVIAPGHILHMDLGVLKDRYASDMQRCWYAPEPGERELPGDVRRALDAVAGAITKGAEALRPGVEAWTVDQAARDYLVSQGYPEYMHALGHQVGRMAHDGGAVLAPRWERYGNIPFMKVQAGEVYTLELGVVLDRRGYLGLEEMVLVTPNGVEWLTERQTDMPLLRVD
jgi:Xaa-Pro aminopeptidase